MIVFLSHKSTVQGELEKMSLFKTAIMSFMKEQFHFIHPYHL